MADKERLEYVDTKEARKLGMHHSSEWWSVEEEIARDNIYTNTFRKIARQQEQQWGLDTRNK